MFDTEADIIKMPELFDEYGYTGYPITINNMEKELKEIIADYQDKKLTNEEFKIIVGFYGITSPDKLFDKEDENELSFTLRTRIGKYRSGVLMKALTELGIVEVT